MALAVAFAARAVVLQSAKAAYEAVDAAMAELADDLRRAASSAGLPGGSGRDSRPALADLVGAEIGIAALVDDPERCSPSTPAWSTTWWVPRRGPAPCSPGWYPRPALAGRR